jgi:RNA-directed DNA polymerase
VATKYVLDADIQGCFDNIAHQPLLDKLHTYPAMRRTIKGWLKAGVLTRGIWTPTELGSPQGGVVSPLLALIALYGLETAITSAFPPRDRPQVVVMRTTSWCGIRLARASRKRSASQRSG